LLLVAWSGSARAAGPAAGQDLTPTARELSDQALRQYQRGEFDAAIESFMGAFALSKNPGLLFNVAQAYRLKGDCEQARDYYQRYLNAEHESPFKLSLERRVAEMEACVTSRRPKEAMTTAAATKTAATKTAAAITTAAAATTTTGPTTTATTTAGLTALPAPALAASRLEASPRRRAAAWTLRGSAAVLLVSSAVFGALAWDARQDYSGTDVQRVAWEANDRYETNTALAWTFAASGVACAVISYFVDRSR
jgi:hypothetical protein